MRFTGDRLASIALLRAAVDKLEAIPYLEHAARLRRRLAEPFFELEDLKGAERELRSAFDAFHRLKAYPWMEEIRERMRQKGLKPFPMPKLGEGLGLLTATEVAVAREAARGKSNREIGGSLGISHRTAGTHLNNIYKKLGIHGKVELTRWLQEHDGDGA
jgi:DNA-binding CsgD family transcriptional regulator